MHFQAGNWHGATVQGMAACHVRPADQPVGPRPSGPVQPRRRPVARERGARRTHSRRGHCAVATRAATGRQGWSTCSGIQGVPEKVV
jgi:hypothetical protein